MNANELLCYLTDKQIDRLFEIARKIPADKLDWKPGPDARSTLDQLQEVATSLQRFLPGIKARKVEFDPEMFAQWVAERKQITSLDELEKLTRESTKELTDYVRTVPEADLDLPVDMPFPGEFKVADVLAYHLWNSSYHEGQINTLAFLIGA
jgi:uncharacterized damage-inducible protein DinB